MIEHRPGDAAVSTHESEAISEIDHAISELKRAAIDDGKNIHDHPNVDVPNDYRGRLHKAADLLRKVHADTYREEDNPDAEDLGIAPSGTSMPRYMRRNKQFMM